MTRRPFPWCLLLLFASFSGFAADDGAEYFFFRHPGYGSQSVFNPATVFLNGAFDVVQTGCADPDPFRLPVRDGAKNVFMNVSHPLRQIGRHGWGDFIAEEVFPARLHRAKAQYLPNYTLHLLGGGVTYRMLWEWSRFHNVPHPRLAAAAFTAAYHVMNEIVENGSFRGVNTDPIADLLLFDPLSVLLFQSEGVARFFGRTVALSDWSTMPFYDPVNKIIDNASQNYAVGIPLPKTDRWRIFAYLGMNELAGLSWRRGNGYSVSGGGGFTVKELVTVDSNSSTGRVLTITHCWNAGLFIDKNKSLLFSILASGGRFYKARMNLYPLPNFSLGKLRPAFFAALGKKNELVLGITADRLPVSLSARVP